MSTTEGTIVVIVDTGTTDGVPSVDPGGFSKLDPPTSLVSALHLHYFASPSSYTLFYCILCIEGTCTLYCWGWGT